MEAPQPAGGLQQQRSIFADTGRNTYMFTQVGKHNRDRATSQRMITIPLLLESGKPGRGELREQCGKLRQDHAKDLIASEQRPRGCEIGHRLIDAAAHLLFQSHIDADTDYCGAWTHGVPLQFHQHTRELPRSKALPRLIHIIDNAIQRAISTSDPTAEILRTAQAEASAFRLD